MGVNCLSTQCLPSFPKVGTCVITVANIMRFCDKSGMTTLTC